MDELILQFVVEARELVQQASDDLLFLERNPKNAPRINSVFRAVHTLKGSVGLFDLHPMHEVLHRAEDLLGSAQSGLDVLDAGSIDALISVIDWVELCVRDIANLERLSDDVADQFPTILKMLEFIPTVSDDVSTADMSNGYEWSRSLLAAGKFSLADGLTAIRYEPHPECFFNGDDPLGKMMLIPQIIHLQISPREPWPEMDAYNPFHCNLVIEALARCPIDDAEAVFRLIPDQVRIQHLTEQATQEKSENIGQATNHVATMRIDASRIDALVDIAGQLVTAKNSLVPLAEAARASQGGEQLSRQILNSHQQIEGLVNELHGAVARARMVSLGNTFRRLPRVVREIAARLGKSVDLVIEGDDIEADRQIVDEIFEPLLHLIRNALDHGIEAKAERISAGKAEKSTLTVKATQFADQIQIEVGDDGRGIDVDAIKDRAKSIGLITEQDASTFSSKDAMQLLFTPGFSTAATISDLSGRGVGLDVVKIAIEKLGGRIELSSVPNSGTRVSIRLPISITMSRLLIVETSNERYGIPIESILETCRLPSNRVFAVRSGEAFILRDRTIPLLRLHALLSLEVSDKAKDEIKVLLVDTGYGRVGIAVDGISERSETLMRPLSGLLEGLHGIAGTTLLGDGNVLLVLDVRELIG